MVSEVTYWNGLLIICTIENSMYFYNSCKSDYKKYLMWGTTRLNIGPIIIYTVC